MMMQVIDFLETTPMLSPEMANNITDKEVRRLRKEVVADLSM